MFSGVVLQDGWMKNMYWSVETDADLGKHFDQWKNSYQEIEINKPVPLGQSDFYLEPGAVFHWEQAGSRVDPYIGLGYHFDATWNAVLRYRYNHQNHDDIALDGSYDDSSEHRVDLYLTKVFTSNFQAQYNPTYYSKVHSDKFTYTNGKNHTLQHNFVFTWHATPRIYPFAELGYMDKYKRGNSTENDYQIRLGVTFDIN